MEREVRPNIEDIERRLQALRLEKEELLEEASKIEGAYLSTYEIRPAGRHVLTIGENLIQDQYAAIIELVKNCYDADSPDVNIVFKSIREKDCLEIRIEDHGHGMSTKDVINKWLVPSTDSKQACRISPAGRIMQGRKGIGRYAASILGKDLTLQTVDTTGIKTELCIEWGKVARYEYLDQIQIPIKTEKTSKDSGTVLIMHSKLSENQYWTDKTIRKLRFELKKLIPPKTERTIDDSFKIILTFESFFLEDAYNTSEELVPFPILDYYDYRISGDISVDGVGMFIYENKIIDNSAMEQIEFNYGPTLCGSLSIDIRVYDRDKEAISRLISRGLQDKYGDYISKQEARQLLNSVNGIGVYRNGFRIRPLGDADYDWLKLNQQRVQNPSMKIGSNQVVGYVYVESEEDSGLEEKSARDGLKDNKAYESLKKITCAVIFELEKRRYIFRRKIGISNAAKKLEKQFDELYDYAQLKENISKTLEKAGLAISVNKSIMEILEKDEQRRNESVEEIRRAVAMYQGQATLGKIIHIVLHEGRRPLNYFKNQIPNLRFYGEHYKKVGDSESYEEIARITDGLLDNARHFVTLFGKLDPLAAKRRETKNIFSLQRVLRESVAVFDEEYKQKDIIVELDCPMDISFLGWKQDIYTIMVNLIDNSIFWIAEKECKERKICILVEKNDNGFTLDYTDSGPGIDSELIASGVIFEPEFSTKPPKAPGTGLGLAIAGEAATRNGLVLTAVQSDNGAHFVLSTDEGDINDV